jgi:hypothetical protein
VSLDATLRKNWKEGKVISVVGQADQVVVLEALFSTEPFNDERGRVARYGGGGHVILAQITRARHGWCRSAMNTVR